MLRKMKPLFKHAPYLILLLIWLRKRSGLALRAVSKRRDTSASTPTLK